MKYLFTSILITICLTVFSQQIGTKVSLADVSGKRYTGIITEINGSQYKVKYDGYEFSAWLTSAQFAVINSTPPQPVVNNNQPKKNSNWQVGDKVEAYDMYANKWSNGTISIVLTDRTPLAWRVTFDDPKGHTFEYLSLNLKDIRPRGSKSNFNLVVGSRVDAYYTSGGPKSRATIIEDKGNGRYKVKYDGCKDYWDEVVDWSQLKPESVITANDPDIAQTIGKWAMFVYSYPNTVIHGDNVYREYGTGAKAPPLQINANGTYVWYDEFNKPPVKGNWATHSKIEGLTMGTEAVNGVIIQDSRGNSWKIHKDRADHIEARLMCSGETQGGTRIK